MSNKVFALLVLLAQVALYAWWLKETPKVTSDFPAYYAIAQLWKRGENPYSLDNQCREEAKTISTGCSPFAHPPVLLPLLAIVSSDNFEASYWRWVIILCAAVALCALPLYWLSGDWPQSLQALVFYPGVVAVFFGNDVPFVLLAVCFCVWLVHQQKDFWAGCVLALSVIKPQFAIILSVPFLFTRPKVFLGFISVSAFFVFLCFLLVGYSGLAGLLEITRLMSEGNGYGIRQEHMINITGVLVRNGLSPFWSWPCYALAIAAVSIIYKLRGATLETMSVGILLALFAAPHAHLYDLALLAIPLLFAHRLAPMIGSLMMIVAMSTSKGYRGALVLILGLLVIYMYKLNRSDHPVPVTQADALN